MKAQLTPLREKFFKASSTAAIDMFKLRGQIPVTISALIKNKNKHELVPVSTNVSSKNEVPELVMDRDVRELVKFVNENGGSPIIFFISILGEGSVRQDGKDGPTNKSVIINSARTVDNMGKTSVYEISPVEIKLMYEDSEWKQRPEEGDLPAITAQQILDKVWKSFIVNKNMSALV